MFPMFVLLVLFGELDPAQEFWSAVSSLSFKSTSCVYIRPEDLSGSYHDIFTLI
jgi:hypothetical protein